MFFKFFEDRFHKKAETWKRKMYKIGALILQEKNNINDICEMCSA